MKRKIVIGLFFCFTFSHQLSVGQAEQSADAHFKRIENSKIIQSLYPQIKEKLKLMNWKINHQHKSFDEIIPHLYLGNYDAFRSIDISKANPFNIKKVVRITDMSYQDIKLSRWYVNPCTDIEILDIGINVQDRPENNFLLLDRASGVEQSYEQLNAEQWFEKTFTLIDKSLIEGSNVLVHCVVGRSRSSTIVIAYLISRFDVSYEVAREYVKGCRPCVEPNYGFRDLLRIYRKQLPKLENIRL